MYPDSFVQQTRRLIGDEAWAALEKALQETPPVSIRLHSAKIPLDPDALPVFDGAVPWHPQGRYLKERPVFTLDPLFHAGAYYVQEASSMFVYEVLRQTGRLTQKNLKVLDLCAAPGGKTTLLYDALDGALAANEVVPQRAAILRENMERWGASDIAVLSAAPQAFEHLQGCFDVILVDAPCSGEGMFRKDPDAIREWSPENVQACTARQAQVLESAESVLAPGGLLIYSTCTYNREENEATFLRFCEKNHRSPIVLDLPDAWGVAATDAGYRFFPHRVRGEGFFIAACEKQTDARPGPWGGTGYRQLSPLPRKQKALLDGWLAPGAALDFWTIPSGEILALPADKADFFKGLDPFFSGKWYGCPIGQLKGTDFIPSHALALSPLISPDIPRVGLDREQALVYLKKENPAIGPAPKGWVLAAYSGLPLGWMKILPNRINNYLPNERRIRMKI